MEYKRVNVTLSPDILSDLNKLQIATGINRSKLISIGVKMLKYETRQMIKSLEDKANEDLNQGLLSMLITDY